MDERYKVLSTNCRELLEAVGEDPEREGLVRTPHRYAKALLELTSGYEQDLNDLINQAVFEERYSEMVVVKGIEFYSLCEHHVLPFFGHATVAYIPDGRIIGLSKIPRIVEMFARRLQVQERLTEQVVEAIDQILEPAGVACTIEARHLCMMMRGAEVQSSTIITNSMRGVFLKDERTRSEFMSIVGKRRE